MTQSQCCDRCSVEVVPAAMHIRLNEALCLDAVCPCHQATEQTERCAVLVDDYEGSEVPCGLNWYHCIHNAGARQRYGDKYEIKSFEGGMAQPPQSDWRSRYDSTDLPAPWATVRDNIAWLMECERDHGDLIIAEEAIHTAIKAFIESELDRVREEVVDKAITLFESDNLHLSSEYIDALRAIKSSGRD